MDKKIIGIIGGMGPLATDDLFHKIIVNTDAVKDQDHIRVLIDNNTNIPDRTKAILHGGDSPVEALSESAVKLEKMGANLLVMPCNTAHYFYEDVSVCVSVPVLNMISVTGRILSEKGIKKAGLLATDGTVQSGIYERELQKYGIEVIKPDADGQKNVMDMIYGGVKAGLAEYDTAEIRKAIENILDSGAQILILGCTELPLAMEMYKLDYPIIDPTLELAREAIKHAGAKLA